MDGGGKGRNEYIDKDVVWVLSTLQVPLNDMFGYSTELRSATQVWYTLTLITTRWWHDLPHPLSHVDDMTCHTLFYRARVSLRWSTASTRQCCHTSSRSWPSYGRRRESRRTSSGGIQIQSYLDTLFIANILHCTINDDCCVLAIPVLCLTTMFYDPIPVDNCSGSSSLCRHNLMKGNLAPECVVYCMSHLRQNCAWFVVG